MSSARVAGGVAELVNLADTTVVKSGNAFCVALRDGGLPTKQDHPLGVYLNDCRHLRGHELRIGGQPPRLLISSDAAGTAAAFELTNPDLVLATGQALPLQSLRVRIERRMLPGGMVDRITLHSHARDPIDLTLELRLDARNGRREQQTDRNAEEQHRDDGERAEEPAAEVRRFPERGGVEE